MDRLQGLSIVLDKKFYNPLGIVRGSIILKSRYPIHISSLTVYFSKSRKVCVSKTFRAVIRENEQYGSCDVFQGHDDSGDSNKLQRTISDDISIKEFDEKVFLPNEYISDIELSSGKHEFNFKFILNSICMTSTQSKGCYNDAVIEIENTYTLSAECRLNDSSMLRCQTPVNICDFPDQSCVVEANIRVKCFLGMFCKKYGFLLEVDRNMYTVGDLIRASLRPKIPMKSELIRSVQFNLFEMFKYKVGSQQFIRTRVLERGNGNYRNNNCFDGEIRIPGGANGSCDENTFAISIVLECQISLYKGGDVKIKKILSVRKFLLFIPHLVSSIGVLDGRTFEEQLLTFE